MRTLQVTAIAAVLSLVSYPLYAQTKLDNGIILPKKHDKAEKPKAEPKKGDKKADKKGK